MPFAVISLAASRLSIEPFPQPESLEESLRAPHQLAVPRLAPLSIITRTHRLDSHHDLFFSLDSPSHTLPRDR